MRKLAALLQKDMRLYGRKMLSTLLTAALLLCGTAAALAALLGSALAEPESAFAVEVLPAAESGVGLLEHYLLAFLVFFLLLTEVLFFPFTVRDFSPPMLRRITSYGIRPLTLLAEKTVLPFFLRFLLFAAVLCLSTARLTPAAVLLALGALLLGSLFCTALSVILSQSRLGIALLFAVATAGLFADGGLLPRAMLPYAMTQAGSYLPSGLLARLLAPLYGGAADMPALLLMAAYTAAAILGACLYAGRLCRKGGAAP